MQPPDTIQTVLPRGAPGPSAAARATAPAPSATTFARSASRPVQPSVAAPVVIYFALGDRSGPILENLKDWMAHHNAAIMTVLMLVIGMKLVVGDSPGNQTWLPQALSVDINGVEVLTHDLRGTRLGPRGSVDLEYPDPVQVDTPVLAPTAVRIETVPQ